MQYVFNKIAETPIDGGLAFLLGERRKRIDSSNLVRHKSRAAIHAKEILTAVGNPGGVAPVPFLTAQQGNLS